MQFLSNEWFSQANQKLQEVQFQERCIIRTIINNDDSNIVYDLVLDPAGTSYDYPVNESDYSVSVQMDYKSACAIAQGHVNPKSLFLAGKLKVGGDVVKLSEIASALSSIDDTLVALRAATIY